MSKILRARAILQDILEDTSCPPDIRKQVRRALGLMYRVPYVRRAPAKRKIIDRGLRRRVRHLVGTTDMTMHEIANVVGLRSSGRVSEVMHHKR